MTQGRLRFFDNNVLRTDTYAAYGDIALAVKTEANRLVCWDIANPGTLETLEFHRA